MDNFCLRVSQSSILLFKIGIWSAKDIRKDVLIFQIWGSALATPRLSVLRVVLEHTEPSGQTLIGGSVLTKKESDFLKWRFKKCGLLINGAKKSGHETHVARFRRCYDYPILCVSGAIQLVRNSSYSGKLLRTAIKDTTRRAWKMTTNYFCS